MKRAKYSKSLFFLATMLFASSALAVKPGEEDDKKECKKPKFRDFVPENKAEVPPESEVSFHVSKGAALTSITAEAKGQKLPVSVDNRKTFIIVKTKLPADIREGFARIHVTARADEGDCLGQDGWLIKVIDPSAAQAPSSDAASSEISAASSAEKPATEAANP